LRDLFECIVEEVRKVEQSAHQEGPTEENPKR
jgi:hypothetical protein